MGDEAKTGEAGEVDAKVQRRELTTMKRKGRKAIERTNQKLERLEITYMKIADLRPNGYNPNRQSKHDFELLCRSMEEDGFTQPVVALADGEIVDGEHRWRAAQQLGYEEIPVVVTTMTREQMQIATLRHNRARGSEDIELSAQVLRDLRELGALDWAQDSLMLDDVEMERLLEDIPAPEELASDEFGMAWEPERGVSSTDDHKPDVELSTMEDASGNINAAAVTQAAKEDIRVREERLAAAKTEEERQMAGKEMKLYRLALTFSGEEAKVVKAALGKRSAEVLLKMCQDKVAAEGDEAQDADQGAES